MRVFYYSFSLVFLCQFLNAQERTTISASIIDQLTKEVIPNAIISVEGEQTPEQVSRNGKIEISVNLEGQHILNISAPNFLTKRMPVYLESQHLELGIVLLERDITFEKADNLITLTDADLSEDNSTMVTSGLLQATKDVFLNRAAFDFGQAFFRVRGYDSQNSRVLINGMPMNKLFDGRPQWNNWGGLNDVTRNQEYTNALNASDYTFGGILGNTNIDMRPSGFRPGFRFSTSSSNRTYTDRAMATYTSSKKKKGLLYTISASRRWAKEGYISGTLYDAFSVFGAMELQINQNNSIAATAIFAQNRRGRSSAITEEVFDLVGKQYNPYWGNQNGELRNSRERKISEPIVMFNHYYESVSFNLSSGIMYQTGINSRSRLGYYNAPNPDPTYYRYLPSFYINSPIGANFVSGELAKEGFKENPQLQWNNLYKANNQDKASYVLYDDVVADNQWALNIIGNLKFDNPLSIDFGVNFKSLASDNFAEINDLLGAEFHEDLDSFSETQNNLGADLKRKKGDKFNYHYNIEASDLNSFAQIRYSRNKWKGFVAGSYSITKYQREGLFKNERFLDNSLGQSEQLSFTNFGAKGGLSYGITGRHWLKANAVYSTNPPVLQNVFINPRENNAVVPGLQSETIGSLDVSYFLRLPKLTGRLSGFYTQFQNTTDINFFFVDAGVGSDFVQEVITDLDKLHAGIELGLEFQLSSSVKLSTVAAMGKYNYASNPNVTINFDTAGKDEDLINSEGNIDLGTASIKDLMLAQGPQKAFALGMEYRDPKYWWVGVTTNYLANNYANISTITRTQSFYLDPDTGLPFHDATDENVSKVLQQKPLDNFYLLNLVGGKSWLKKGKYISVFASVNNAFDSVFRTGGYEQSRNGNFGQLREDHLSGNPSFAPKYWYGYGRTYFLNVAYSF